jgi:hypothetical protein
MKPLRSFKEFLKEGVVKKSTPDFLRVKSLVEEAGEERYAVRVGDIRGREIHYPAG